MILQTLDFLVSVYKFLIALHKNVVYQRWDSLSWIMLEAANVGLLIAVWSMVNVSLELDIREFTLCPLQWLVRTINVIIKK